MHNTYGERLESVLHEAEREDVLVLIAHGLTGDMDRDLCKSLAEGLAAKGWSSLRFSYSGHGGSDGEFSEMTITKEVEDLQAILDQVAGARRIVYVGHSMGGAVGALTAAKDDRIQLLVSLAGMVNTKQFYDQEFGHQEAGSSVMWEEDSFPLSEAFKDDLHRIQSVISAVQEIRVPWLLIHGDADDVVLPSHSEELYRALKGRKEHVLLEGVGHQFAGVETQLIELVDGWIQTLKKNA